MQISYNWLKQFINIDWEAEKTGNLLTDLGLEVEGIEAFQSVKGGLKGIVVGHVLTCVKHPNADRLKLTTVDLGDGEPVQIVCGAPNVDAGQKVPVATVGTTLYDDKGEPWKIKKGKIRGEVSNGMICAEDELGLGESHDGIMILEEDLKPGTPLAKIFEVEDDYVFEIGLTPNRADAMSHMGTARDLRAGLIQSGVHPEFITPSTSSFRIDNRTQKISVQVLNNEKAPRYCGITLSGLTVKESPAWIQNRLKAIGLTPKNNIVDITNYVLHELGQPLHAFDLAKIAGKQINVKTVAAGTKFTTLDGIERELHEEDLMICDAEKPMCIAGVFGGEHSGVTEETTSIFLESAYFDPVNIRKTAKRHALNTDASFRFERGIDPNITEYALIRAVLLIQECAGGEVTSDVVDFYPKKIEDHQVVLNFDRAEKLIGEAIPKETIKSILSSLDIKINNITESGIGMTIPAYRNDVTREVDVIEEILRVYGYNKIQFKSKLNASVSKSSRFADHKIQQVTGTLLASLGFNEILNNSLTSPVYASLNDAFKEDYNVTMLNPLSTDLSVMRQSLLFSGLEVVAFNSNRRQPDLKLFEFGKSYHNFPGGREEYKHLTLLLSGKQNAENWFQQQQNTTFFDLKGSVEAVLSRLGIAQWKVKPVKDTQFSEGLEYTVQKKQVVSFGLVSKAIRKHFDIEQEVLFADFNWDTILDLVQQNSIKFVPIPKNPAVRRDFALLLDQDVTFDQIYQEAFMVEKKLLQNVALFDVYEGKNLPEGKKSYAVSFTLQDEHKTLTDKEIDKIMNKLQQRFEKSLNAELR
ncbi:phenylalanine--tRNA ligase subunit beta [Leeuwenhoekiella palythoae]|uniref:phenylalanine--tRNA ligase subunit beta n=1 Tax=Leeuwenhoekiella palythoae TaxID=573501 RepID=UPI000E90B682|nr:phenylalanine--tRNA ligase subunit beta [Leeuwenhoekiella palythoae]UBZ10862.1 phenylalanine--tRNA ligase subunit beta [Leeuwenhoekiella palythoae]HAX16221.1 phenylalanine--tRNA ligase subunit beta [Leeuwenhoekiella sp.]|tara:strand:+ start:3334 stop:5760 length:2427 start_codon:yes stop_codon:yes gene_type:complete